MRQAAGQRLRPLRSLKTGSVEIQIRNAGPGTLRIRKPEWAEAVTVHGGGQPLQTTENSGYLHLEHAPRNGDVLTVAYAMKLRKLPAGPERVSCWYGPWLLGAPGSQNIAYFNDLTTSNRLLGSVAAADVKSSASGPPASGQPRFTVPVAAQVFRYANAEFPDQPSTVIPESHGRTGRPGALLVGAEISHRALCLGFQHHVNAI